MADPLTESFEIIKNRIINIEQGLDNLTERIKDLQRSHNQQIGQIERLFTLYKEIQVEIDDVKRDMNKNYIDPMINELRKNKKSNKKKIIGENNDETKK